MKMKTLILSLGLIIAAALFSAGCCAWRGGGRSSANPSATHDHSGHSH